MSIVLFFNYLHSFILIYNEYKTINHEYLIAVVLFSRNTASVVIIFYLKFYFYSPIPVKIIQILNLWKGHLRFLHPAQ